MTAEPVEITTDESATLPAESEIIARWCIAFGKYSRSEIADRIGASRETVRRISLGQLPTTLFVARACQAFGVRTEWILLGKGPMHTEPEFVPGSLSS